MTYLLCLVPRTRSSAAATAIVCVGVLGILTASASMAAKDKESDARWEAPARAARKKNPIPADERSVEAGRGVYVAECLDCHGKSGAGDGPGARDLRRRPPDLSQESIRPQSDGAMFWKISEGRKEMPGYDELLSEEERWHVVNYLRALSPRESNTTQPSAPPDGGDK